MTIGCDKTELSGGLSVDGQEFTMAGCRNGSVRGFMGVELHTESGQRLRIAHTVGDQAIVVLMPREGAPGIDLGSCGWFRFAEDTSTVNHIRNVSGEAKLECTASGHSVVGSVAFKNCH
jgi:hypothetical protein